MLPPLSLPLSWEIAWGGSCFVRERHRERKLLGRMLPTVKNYAWAERGGRGRGDVSYCTSCLDVLIPASSCSVKLFSCLGWVAFKDVSPFLCPESRRPNWVNVPSSSEKVGRGKAPSPTLPSKSAFWHFFKKLFLLQHSSLPPLSARAVISRSTEKTPQFHLSRSQGGGGEGLPRRVKIAHSAEMPFNIAAAAIRHWRGRMYNYARKRGGILKVQLLT